jgi:MFS family permease
MNKLYVLCIVKRFPYLTRNILILSLVSLLNDMSSELIYPLIPIYLSTLGSAPLFIGLIEGVAECINAILKLNSGFWSDKIGRRKPFVMLGYGLSAFSKLVLTLMVSVSGVFASRIIDRFGKGLRSPARDALLHDNAMEGKSGAVFGFHRSADTIGAVIGPLLALVFVGVLSWKIPAIFAFAIIPTTIALFAICFIKEKKTIIPILKKSNTSFRELQNFFLSSPKAFKRVLLLFSLFSLFNSSDMFLLLILKEKGFSISLSLWHYIAFNLSLVVCSWPIGIASDKWNKEKLLWIGFLFFSISYFLIGFCDQTIFTFLGFLLYGLYYACTDGISKSLVADTVQKEYKATALGLLSTIQSVLMLVGSLITGIIWQFTSGKIALIVSACGVLVVTVIFYLYSLSKKQS